jgi:hypothetical protein
MGLWCTIRNQVKVIGIAEVRVIRENMVRLPLLPISRKRELNPMITL